MSMLHPLGHTYLVGFIPPSPVVGKVGGRAGMPPSSLLFPRESPHSGSWCPFLFGEPGDPYELGSMAGTSILWVVRAFRSPSLAQPGALLLWARTSAGCDGVLSKPHVLTSSQRHRRGPSSWRGTWMYTYRIPKRSADLENI